MNFLSFLSFFIINLPCSAAAQWMAIKCIPEVQASTIGIEISPTHPLIFTMECQSVRNLASFSTLLKFEPPAFENAAIYRTSETKFLCYRDRTMSSPSLVKLGPRTPENRSEKCPPPKIARRKRAKSSISQPWIVRCHSNFVQSLNT